MLKVGHDRQAHPRADVNGWVPEHIIVAEKKYRVPIDRTLTVHHRNADRSDNRPENLDLRVGNHGKGGELMDTLLLDPDTRALAVAALRRYGYSVTEPTP